MTAGPPAFPVDRAFWRGRRVFVTGHTGFKGSWLTLWLARLGARVRGFALPPETTPNLFGLLGLADACEHVEGDVRVHAEVVRALGDFRPQVVIHMAAQALVRRSYRDPLATIETNVLGTLNVLDACRHARGLEAAVIVTSDKVYQNPENGRAHPEGDPLGGFDPYSASKAAAEMIAAGYRQSFFAAAGAAAGVAMATARAGNVFGTGDWSEDRLVADAARAFAAGRPLILRNGGAGRPWQHVAGPISGYLMLARACVEGGAAYARAWNFGPPPGQRLTAAEVAAAFAAAWGDGARWEARPEAGAPHEARLLSLDPGLARRRLGWRPRGGVRAALTATAAGYRACQAGARAGALTELVWSHIERFGAA